jgi:four helix bundle protein
MDGKNFRDLKVWQLGMQLAEEVYRLTQQFPKHEIYGLTSQVQRAAVSVPANIAEGHATGSSKEFLRFLGIAQGSLAELETHLLLAERIKYCSGSQVGPIVTRCHEEGRMLRALRKSVRRRLNK